MRPRSAVCVKCHMKNIGAVTGLMLIFGALSGCFTPGYADNWSGRAAAAKMCGSMRAFVRAPLDDSELRRAWFLPLGSYDDGSFDFYAPMASDPSDAASGSFYKNKVGQLTHYTTAPDFAAALASCLSPSYGYANVFQMQTKDTFRASFTHNRSGRSVEILAKDNSTTVLIAGKGWAGDFEQALVYKPNECEVARE